MKAKGPIGVFDSGLGGLTVMKCIMERLPNETIVYFADEAHVPYGSRDTTEVRDFALGITRFLIDLGAKSVVMACNMSSATALVPVRELYPDVPIVGMVEAGAHAAARLWNRGPIGVLATLGTVRTRAYTTALQALIPGVSVYEQPCPRFVPLVEAGMSDSSEARLAVREYLEPVLEQGCETIILGCTHYPFLVSLIQEFIGGGVKLVDPSGEVVEELAQTLIRIGALGTGAHEPHHVFYSSSPSMRLVEIGSKFLDRQILFVHKAEWVDGRVVELHDAQLGKPADMLAKSGKELGYVEGRWSSK